MSLSFGGSVPWRWSMKKLLLVVLAWMVLGGANRAEDAPAGTLDAEPGMVTLAAQHIQRAKCWLAGRFLACFIEKGMDLEQVRLIIGNHAIPSGGVGRASYYYPNLRITVRFVLDSNAARDCWYRMTDIFFVRY
jgi:hypothetical protein